MLYIHVYVVQMQIAWDLLLNAETHDINSLTIFSYKEILDEMRHVQCIFSKQYRPKNSFDSINMSSSNLNKIGFNL